MSSMSKQARKRALLVIDPQKIYTDPSADLFCEDADQTIDRINKLIDQFHKNNELIVYIQHIHKEDGSDAGRLFDFAGEAEEIGFVEGSDEVAFDPSLALKSDHIITKNRYSAFQGTGLDALLRQNGVEDVVITGFMTNFCCTSTTRQALDLDYFVSFVIDATGTPGLDGYDQDQIRQITRDFLGAGFAVIRETADILAS